MIFEESVMVEFKKKEKLNSLIMYPTAEIKALHEYDKLEFGYLFKNKRDLLFLKKRNNSYLSESTNQSIDIIKYTYIS